MDGDFRRGKKRRGGWRIAGPIIIICAVIAVLVAVDYGLNSGRIYWGVEVGTVSLGGKTPAEAREAVEERTTGALKQFEFSGPQDFEFTADEMGVDFDVASTVDEAYSVGRRGSILDRLKERAQGVYSAVQIEPEVDYQPEVAKIKVNNLAERLNEDPVEAAVEIYGSEVQTTDSSEGYQMNVPATMKNVNGAVDDMTGNVEIAGKPLEPEIITSEAEQAAEKVKKVTSGQVNLTAEGQQWTISPADLGSTLDINQEDGKLQVEMSRERLKERLGNVYGALTVKAKEADYEVSGTEISVVPSQTGKSIESQKFMGAIEQGVFEGKREYQVPVVTAEPGLTTAEANDLMPTDLMGSYRTNYGIVEDPGQQRKENLQIASNAVNGTMVAPGEIFSMNDQVMGLDYNSTKVIIEGQETKADGGGLCQVTSTLYMAANFAGLDVVERYPHNAQLPYIRPGLDATVWFGDGYGNGELDMKFENTTDGYLLLQQYVANDGHIYADIYGKPNGKEVSMTSKPLYKGADASKWITYQTVTENGETLYDGELHTDVYYPLTDEKGKTIKPTEVYVPPVRP
ncbi:MAG: peptidoglycan binding domain-containing protein [Rubrobacteraceae bacterium]